VRKRLGKFDPRKRKNPDVQYGKFTALGLAMFGLFCFVNVWQNVSIDEMNRRNGKMQLKLQELKGDCALLTARVEELKDPDRIADIAQKKLGMSQARKMKVPAATGEE
jgi:cell division protein FtsL